MKTQSYRTMFVGMLSVILFSLSSYADSHAADPETVKTAVAVRINSPPRIDGRLDDPAWEKAIPTSDFIQMDPEEGTPARQQTVVRVLYDDRNVYFGIECLDAEPEKIAAKVIPRDTGWWPDDLICIVLDTYHDRQNGYAFYTNPRGVQIDMRISADGRSQDWSWDEVWQSEGRITDRGWTVEVAIPFKTLRFPRTEPQVWGLNIKRWRRTGSEDSFWSFISRDDRTELKVSKAGQLVGLEGIQPGLHVEFLPYGVVRYDRRLEEKDWRKDLGLDVKYGIASNLTADATLNPDFAHIEADESQINLSRFELYLWEKRPFFLEGKELFSPMGLFYSRRIADPVFGAKVTGKIGRTSLGLLTAQDREQGPDPLYGVVRIQRDLFKNSAVGFLAVGKQKTQDQYSRAFGLDVSLRPGQNVLNLEWAKSFHPDVHGGDDWMASASFNRSAGRLWIYTRFKELRPEFNVDQIGFIPHDAHVGIRWMTFQLTYYRSDIQRFGIKRLWVGQYGHVNKRTDDDRWGWTWENAYLGVKFHNLHEMQFWHDDWYFRYEGRGYRGDTFGLRHKVFAKGPVRTWEMEAKVEDHYDWGDQYFGKIHQLSLWTDLRPWGNVEIDLNGQLVWEYYPSGKLDQVKKVANVRVTYLPTRDLFFRVFAPLNPSADQYTINALLSWTYRPRSRFYIAYNEQRSEDGRLIERILMTKAAYLWNL